LDRNWTGNRTGRVGWAGGPRACGAMGCGASSPEKQDPPEKTGTVLRKRRASLAGRKTAFLMCNMNEALKTRELRGRSHYMQTGPSSDPEEIAEANARLLNPRFGDPVIREDDGDEFFLEMMSGFRVYKEPSHGGKHLYNMANARLEADLAEVVRVLPEHMVGELRRWSAIFLCDEDHAADKRIGAHCWRVRGAQSKFMAVEVNYSVYTSEEHVGHEPGAILHELLHIYHALFMERVDPIVQRSFELAMVSGRYEKAEEGGELMEGVRPLAADNPSEYFAEVGEAFFSSKRFVNDAFPYVHPELFQYDPVGYHMMELACETNGGDLPTRSEFPARWFVKLSKLFKGNEYDLLAQMRELDVDASGELSEEELAPLWRAVAPEADMDKLSAAILFADVDKSGSINYRELVAWLTAEEGSFLGTHDHTLTKESRSLHRAQSSAAHRLAESDVMQLNREMEALELPSVKDVWDTPNAKFHAFAAAIAAAHDDADAGAGAASPTAVEEPPASGEDPGQQEERAGQGTGEP